MIGTVLRVEGDFEVIGSESGGGSVMEALDVGESASDGLVFFWDGIALYLIKWDPKLVLEWLVDHVLIGVARVGLSNLGAEF